MANNIIRRVWNQNRMVNIEDLTGAAFQAENGGHTFEISGIDDTGAAVALSGTVSGVFRRPDNADIALTGSASDGVVSVTLSEDCYAVPGRFGLTIFVTSNSQKVAVYACVGTVAVSSTGNVAGDTPASVEDLIDDINAAIADLNSAIGQIPASYANVMAAIAPAYSSSALYAVGSYAWYNGSLYRCITAITTAESWTAAHWTPAVMGNDVSNLKRATNALDESCKDGTGVLVQQGYFSDDYKTVDNSFGTYTYKYIATDNIMIWNRDETAGTKAIDISISDSGLTLAQRLVSIADYPVLKIHVSTNVPDSASPKLRVFTYQSNGTTMNHNYYIDLTTGESDLVINVAQKIAENHWANDVYWFLTLFTSSSNTYTENPYVHLTFKGFFTAEQANNSNLAEIITNLRTNVARLESDVQELDDDVTDITELTKAIGEKAASGAPVTITRKAGYLKDDGTYTDTSNAVSSVTDKIKCSEGDIFYYYGRCVDSVVTAMWFADDGSILSTEKIAGDGYANHIFTAPANSDCVVFTSFGNASSFTDYSPALVVTQRTTYISPLSHKKWYPCGDSFTYGEFTGIANSVFTSGKYTGFQKSYPYHIGNRTNMDIYRGSTSGETMATYSGGTVVFSDQNYRFGYKSVPNDADYITLWFGINDSGHNIPIGTISDDDNTTFYGAWNVVLEDLITRCTKAHIGIIVSNNLASAYVDAVIAVAKHWGIPYLDLNYDNNVPLMHYSLRPDASADVKALRNTQFAIGGDNHHPNLEAHEYESYFIEKWLLSL